MKKKDIIGCQCCGPNDVCEYLAHELKRRKDEKFIKGKTTFKKWCEELKKLAPKYDWKCDPVEDCGEESWKDYFNNWYSPEDALIEDRSYDSY